MKMKPWLGLFPARSAFTPSILLLLAFAGCSETATSTRIQDAATGTIDAKTNSPSDAPATALQDAADAGGRASIDTPRATLVPGRFTGVSDMLFARSNHTATLLPDGTVLIAGGLPPANSADAGTPTGTAELYDPATKAFVSTGEMNVSRSSHTATLLKNGQVLLVGGSVYPGIWWATTLVKTAELYDPVHKTFTPTGSLTYPRTKHVAVLLPSGKVLIAGGGFDISTPSPTVDEVYDPDTGEFSRVGTPTMSGNHAAAFSLSDGTALLLGSDTTLNPDGLNADLFHPDTAIETPYKFKDQVAPRGSDHAGQLPDGTILYLSDSGNLSILDPATKAITVLSAFGHSNYRLALLADSSALLFGVDSALTTSNPGAFRFDLAARTLIPTTNAPLAKTDAVPERLSDGKLLITGGTPPGTALPVATAQIYDPKP